MRIGIDARCLMESKRTGVEEYTHFLILNLLKKDSQNQYILFLNSFRPIRTDFSWLKEFPNVQIRCFSWPNKLINFCFWAFGWPCIDRLLGGLDLLIMPNILFTATSKNCKRILSIHDLSFERFFESFSYKRRLWHFLVNPRKLCQKADKILAVSSSTRADLQSLYKIPNQKISVFMPPLGLERFLQNVSVSAIENFRQKYSLPEKFILYLGTLEPRKNLLALISAFEYFKEKHSFVSRDYFLVIAGGNGWLSQSIFRAAKKSPFSKEIIFTGFMTDADKPLLYKAAKIFVYPSFFEGFGFPPLEAMASGLPTITANCSSLPEVVSDSALLIDPYRPYEIFLAISNLLQNEDLYQKYAKRAVKRAEEILKKQKENFSVEEILKI